MKALIVGYGLSGISAKELLEKFGYNVIVAKNKDINTQKLDKKYLDRLFNGLSFIVKSPGVPMDIELLKQAKNRKIKIIGEFELGINFLKSKIIAVTGTNGKTTSVKLLNFLLKDYSNNCFLGGNVGIPVTSFCTKTSKNDIVILECSSFQLEDIKKFSPHIAIITNITPDHLNRHKTLKKYIKCKQNITKNQRERDYLLLNADDEILMQNIPKTKAKIYYFSTKKTVVGCYIKNKSIYFNDNLTKTKIASIKNIKLVGEHNLSNILAVSLSIYLLTKNKDLLKNLKNFEGVEHRIEYVKTVGGVEFYNDSKATNVDSTLVATKSFKAKINLILGGSDKGCDFDDLFIKLPKNIKNIVLFGENKQNIALSAKKFNYKNIFFADTLSGATNLCYNLSKPKEIVLLSPASASFDMFSNYKERGAIFKKIVKEIEYNEDSLCKEHKNK